MSGPLKISVEGPNAHHVLAEFLAIPGIQGRVEPPVGAQNADSSILAAIAAIVGFGADLASLVGLIVEWRDRVKKSPEAHQLDVVIEDAHGNRITLLNSTPEQISSVLASLKP